MPPYDNPTGMFEKTRSFYRKTVRPVTSFTRRRRLEILLDYVSGKNVLDLGCVEHDAAIESKKDWWLHGLIKQKAKSVRGVDYDTAEVELLVKKGYNITVGDVENLNLGCRFDVVIAGELFEHVTNHHGFLESVNRHLNPGGSFVASMPNGNSLNYFIQTLIFGHEVDAWDHTSFFTPVTLSVMLNKCGFDPVEIILYQPDEIYHHEILSHRISSYIFNRIQQLACMVWPSLARGLVVVAKARGAKPAYSL